MAPEQRKNERSVASAGSTAFDRESADWHYAMYYAFYTAADLMDLEEFGGDDPPGCRGMQDAAYEEVAKRIRRMSARYSAKFCR